MYLEREKTRATNNRILKRGGGEKWRDGLNHPPNFSIPPTDMELRFGGLSEQQTGIKKERWRALQVNRWEGRD